MAGKKKVQILYIEDSAQDVFIMKRALKTSPIPLTLHVVKNGTDALSFLRQEGTFKNVQLPHIVLLDLNLPKLGGLEVLEFLKLHESFRSIPVIVITSSKDNKDKESAFKRYASAYITKLPKYHEFEKRIEIMCAFWLGVSELPDRV
jgi:CheY-like chemotaxis protein